jgi:drug/metabolite transporter (DMT)-like permease
MSAICGSLASVCGKLAFDGSLVPQIPIRIVFGLGILAFNSIMLSLYVQVLQSVSALQASLLAFVCNYLVSTIVGIVVFGESVSLHWILGAALMTLGALRISSERPRESFSKKKL